jgi:hypothetical protein
MPFLYAIFLCMAKARDNYWHQPSQKQHINSAPRKIASFHKLWTDILKNEVNKAPTAIGQRKKCKYY